MNDTRPQLLPDPTRFADPIPPPAPSDPTGKTDGYVEIDSSRAPRPVRLTDDSFVLPGSGESQRSSRYPARLVRSIMFSHPARPDHRHGRSLCRTLQVLTAMLGLAVAGLSA